MMQGRVIPLVPATPAEAPMPVTGDPHAGLVAAVLAEVAQELGRLARDPGHLHIIDLHSLPLDAAAGAALRQALGRGEVALRIRSAALTRIEETAYPGAWWQSQGQGDDAAGAATGPGRLDAIVVAMVPPLVAAHADDIADAAQRLARAAPEPAGPPMRPAAVQAPGEGHD